MKKVICLLITVVMLVQCTGIVCAQDWTDSVSPNVDMVVRKNGDATFENGPLNLSGDSAIVDYQVTLEMEPVLNKFVEWYTKGVNIINNLVALGEDETTLMNNLNSLVIDGQFEVKIEYPNTLQVPEKFTNSHHPEYEDMLGFNPEAKTIFTEVADRVVTQGSPKNVITITVGVKGSQTANLTALELYTYRDTYLDDITLTIDEVTIPSTGTYTVRGTLTGYTRTQGTVHNNLNTLRVDYTGVQPDAGKNPSDDADKISATVNLSKAALPGGGGGGSMIALIFNIDGNTSVVDAIYGKTLVRFDELTYPTKPGYKFDGWYYDSTLKRKVEGDVKIGNKVTLYGHFISDILDTEDHFAYVIGYPDGTVRPSNHITREEVTTIFYRLLREDKVVSIVSTDNDFTDVTIDRWSNKAISSLAKEGYVKGYEDGSFRPEQYITRAEFATMATRYAMLEQNKDLSFVDVNGHWAEEYINKAANAGWVKGYEDGSFGPEQYITRAEVMTIINRMLVRYVDAEGLHADTKLWTDMDGSEWYYYNVLEATNAHNYDRREDGMLETWTEITPNKIWIELDEMENPDL